MQVRISFMGMSDEDFSGKICAFKPYDNWDVIIPNMVQKIVNLSETILIVR